MFPRFVIAPLLLCLTGGLAIAAGPDATKVATKAAAGTPAIKVDPAALAAAKGNYLTLCAACHGSKGKGNGIAGRALNPKPADFTKPSKLTVEERSAVILDGGSAHKLSASMAGFRGVISEGDARALAAYVSNFAEN